MAYSVIIFVGLLVGYVCAGTGPLKGPMKGDSDAWNAVRAVESQLKAKGVNRASVVELSYQEVDGGANYYIKLLDNNNDKIYLAKINRDKRFKYTLQKVKPSSRSETIKAF